MNFIVLFASSGDCVGPFASLEAAKQWHAACAAAYQGSNEGLEADFIPLVPVNETIRPKVG